VTKATMSIRNVGYLDDADVRVWASMSYWRADEAMFLSMNICPKKSGEENSETNALKLGEEYLLIMEMAERARILGDLKSIETPYLAEGPDGPEVMMEVSYVPSAFVNWATERLSAFPANLHKAIKEKYPDAFANTVNPSKIGQERSESALRNSQKAKERCIAIAEMLWDQDKSIKIKEMVEREEIQKYGQGSCYEKSTVYDWVTEAAPKNRNKTKQVSNEDPS